MGRRWGSVALRVSIAVLTRTFFQPDEFFQSLEVAHRLVFGYGHLTWEWLALIPVRSFAFPLLFTPAYWLAKVTHLDHTPLLIILPKITAGLFAAVADLAVYDLAATIWGQRYASTALFLSWTSFFNCMALSRSLSNSAETSLTAVALRFWLRYLESIERALQAGKTTTDTGALASALAWAAVACILRPTNAVLWIVLLLHLMFTARRRPAIIGRTLVWCLWLANFAVSVVFWIDTSFFHRPTLTPLNFLLTNLSSVSLFYGNNPWHYYLTQALPIVATTALPFALHGIYTSWRTPSAFKHSRTLALLVAGTLAVYSATGHKEWRFIHPLLPILHVFAAKSLVDLYDRHTKRLASDDDTEEPMPPPSSPLPIRRRHLVLLLLNAPPALYVMLLHGAAQVSVVHHLRAREDLRSVGFLMPCHSTPWQSHLHREDLEGNIWALGCEPPLRGENIATYRDQTRVFYDDPVAYLRRRFPRRVDRHFPPSPQPTTPPGQLPVSWSHSWPSHFVLFGALLDIKGVRELLEETGYREDTRFINGFEEDEKRRGGVQLWRWDASFETRFVTS